MRRIKSRSGRGLRHGRGSKALLAFAALSALGRASLATYSTSGDATVGSGNGGDVASVAGAGEFSSGSFTITGQSFTNGTMQVATGFESNGGILVQSLADYTVTDGLFLTEGDFADSAVTVTGDSLLNTGSAEFLPNSDMYAVNGAIDNISTGSASVTVSNDSSWTNVGGIGVGFLGKGTLNVQGGSEVTTSLLLVGNSGVGTMSVSGSSITVFPDFQIGAFSQGSSVTLDQNSMLTAGVLAISENPGSGNSLLEAVS